MKIVERWKFLDHVFAGKSNQVYSDCETPHVPSTLISVPPTNERIAPFVTRLVRAIVLAYAQAPFWLLFPIRLILLIQLNMCFQFFYSHDEQQLQNWMLGVVVYFDACKP